MTFNFHLSYYFFYRIVVLLLTLPIYRPISTAITTHGFLVINIVKIMLSNKMEVNFLTDSLILYIESWDLKEHRVLFSYITNASTRYVYF
jgi:hypothetical protein